MSQTLSIIWVWVTMHEQSIAIWLEGIALVAIFFLELKEYRRQGRDKKEQHEEWVAQMAIMQSQADASKMAANAAKKSAEVAEMALKLAERADVLLNAASLTLVDSAGIPHTAVNPYSRVTLEFKNFGRTRAQNVRCLIGLIIPGVPESVPPQEPFILGPGATQSVTFHHFKGTLTQQTYQDIVSGAIDLRFAGDVTYEDIFGELHTVSYKGILDPKSGYFLLGDVDPRKKSSE